MMVTQRRKQHRMVEGLLGPALETPEPARVEGVVQCGGEVIPPACPHCRAEAPMWTCDEYRRLATCVACGADFYATRYTVTPPRVRANRGNPHPVPIHDE